MKYLLTLLLMLAGIGRADDLTVPNFPNGKPSSQVVIVVQVTNTFTITPTFTETPIPTKTFTPTATPTLGPDFYAVFKIDENWVSRQAIGRPDFLVHCATFKDVDKKMEHPADEKEYWIEELSKINVDAKLELYAKERQAVDKAKEDMEEKKRKIMEQVN